MMKKNLPKEKRFADQDINMEHLTFPKKPEAVLLVQLGSPEAPSIRSVRHYLAEFLGDPRVLTMPAFLRWMLLHGVILRFRPKRSALLYQKIWQNGSPLRTETAKLVEALAEEYSKKKDAKPVFYAMRYGNPSIKNVLKKIKENGFTRIAVLPLYPHYASATVGTIYEEIMKLIYKNINIPAIRLIPPFYKSSAYLEAMKKLFEKNVNNDSNYHFLFSFHSLPESHIRRADTTKHCLLDKSCCENFHEHNPYCYRAQCIQSALVLAEMWGLSSWEFSFQSRLGRGKWLEPVTAHRLKALPDEGRRKIVVVAPSFVADNLETLEELNNEGREIFLSQGGEDFILLPQLNSESFWIQSLLRIISDCN